MSEIQTELYFLHNNQPVATKNIELWAARSDSPEWRMGSCRIADTSGGTWTLSTVFLGFGERPDMLFESQICNPRGGVAWDCRYATWEGATVGHYGEALRKLHELIAAAELAVKK